MNELLFKNCAYEPLRSVLLWAGLLYRIKIGHERVTYFTTLWSSCERTLSHLILLGSLWPTRSNAVSGILEITQRTTYYSLMKHLFIWVRILYFHGHERVTDMFGFDNCLF